MGPGIPTQIVRRVRGVEAIYARWVQCTVYDKEHAERRLWAMGGPIWGLVWSMWGRFWAVLPTAAANPKLGLGHNLGLRDLNQKLKGPLLGCKPLLTVFALRNGLDAPLDPSVSLGL